MTIADGRAPADRLEPGDPPVDRSDRPAAPAPAPEGSAGTNARRSGSLRIDVLFERAHQPDPRLQKETRALAEAGHRVRVLAWDRTGRLPRRDDDAGVQIVRSRVASYDGRGARQLLYLARAVAGWMPLIRADRPDVLHAVDLPMLVAAIAIAPFAGRPRIVYDAFEVYSIMERHKYPRWLLRAVAVLERYLPRFADVVITVGEGRQAWFRERGVEAVVVANWIDPPSDPPTREAARRRYNIPEGQFTILYAGGLDPTRDLVSLIRHAARRPDDLVLVAGRGSDEERLRAEAAGLPNVRFLGFLTDPVPVTIAADALYYALHDDHPYAAMAAPNNLYVAISHAVPLVHRGQGEIGILATRGDIGAAFHDAASLDAAFDRLRDPAEQAAVRSELRRLQPGYRWSMARDVLVGVYRRIGRTATRPRTAGP
jgi:glycosyltransferase involved in cell wall biosynthesis